MINDNLAKTLQLLHNKQFCSNREADKLGKLSDICSYSTDRISLEYITPNNYYSTDNMLPNKKGATAATYMPKDTLPILCRANNVLISNIRPYFKKILFCHEISGCSADVLCCVPKDNKYAQYLFSSLYSDHFFDFMVSTSKGTKMPRGDKLQIMNYKLYVPTDEELDIFNSLAIPILKLIRSCEIENYELNDIRDTILPALLNGQAKII